MRVAIGLALCVVSAPVMAQTLSDELGDLQSALSSIESTVEDLADDGTDTDDADQAISELEDIVSRLVAFQGTDGDVDDIIDDYPSSISELQDALSEFGEAKARVGETGGDAELCFEQYPRQVPQAYREALEDPDTTKRDLDRIGRAFAYEAEDLLDRARDQIDEIEGHLDAAAQYRPDHRDFKDIERALSDAAEDLFDQESAVFEDVEEGCAPFIEWQDFLAYKDAVQILEEEADAIAEFVADANAWMRENKDINENICESLRLLRDAYCVSDWEDAGDRDLALYDQMADRTARDFRNVLDDMIRDYERNLRDRGQLLAQRDDDAQAAFETIRERHDTIRALRYGRPLLGSNHPKVRVWRTYGIEQHNRLQNDPNCHLVERAIPGTGGRQRVDCINIAACNVIEFKPDSPTGRRDASKVTGYARSLNDWLEDSWPALATEPLPGRSYGSADEFDDDFVLQARVAGCIDDRGEARFTGVPYFYDPCTQDRDLQCVP